ncbi:MMPL family transporter [Streptomyces sp. 8N706]|uniref:MMPL family transporter n=1 Tax=Streptomyces sp. 8N706 TaxID=3457416 RepID=UPI003FD31DDB
MATLLYRIGRGAYRHCRLVLTLWLVTLAVVAGCAGAFGSRLDNDFTIPGSESQRALDSMAESFPAAAGTSAQLVFSAPEGTRVMDQRYAAALEKTFAAAGKAPEVAAVVRPQQAGTVSKDGTTALAQVNYPVDRSALDEDTLDALERTVAPAEEAGLTVAVGGQAYGNGVVSVSALELLGVVVALAVLALTLGSLLAAGMPLLSAFVGVAVGLCGLLALSSAVSVSSTALTLALMLGLAVGIDYALFILSRHRGQLARGMDPRESAAVANGTAGSAVVFAGATVVIALAGLSVVRIPFLTVMGLSAAGAVAIAVLVATTLLPAVLGLAGGRLAPGPGSRAARRAERERAAEAEELYGKPAAGDGAADSGVPAAGAEGAATVADGRPADAAAATGGERWTRLVIRRPLVTVMAVAAALLTVAVPAMDLRLALPDNGGAAEDTSQRRAYDTITDAFGAGFNGPLLVLVETGTPGAGGERTAGGIAGQLRDLPGVSAMGKPQYDPESGDAVVQIVPGGGPQDEATEELVQRIRDRVPGMERESGAEISVTGTTAVGIDVSDRLSESLVPFAAVVVGLCLVLLLLVFRSVAVPVKATLGFLLSVAASFGAVVAVFQWGWLADLLGVARTGPVVSFLPVVLIGVLFGLAMDYEVFLVSSMREEWIRTGQARKAVVLGARRASRVVTAAALIMFFVFASFVTTEDTFVKPIAFALAFGVLVDAFLVRMTFVPAVLALVGRGAWWLPRFLDRLLPDLDIEGERLHTVGQKNSGGNAEGGIPNSAESAVRGGE